MASLYGSRWQRARLLFLSEHPLCVFCERTGRTRAASVVDHITPHRGDLQLFWSQSNWQPLCASCHDGTKRSIERGTAAPRTGCDANGWPVGAGHHWNRRATK